MKNIRKLNSILFDAAGAGFLLIPFIALLVLGPVIAALIIWSMRLIKRAKEKARIARINEQIQTNKK
jgi:hypothetical protein